MVSQGKVERRLADFVTACQREGIKATHQRLEILRELAGTEEHPDAETIYARVHDRLPTLSLDTVYRTLRLFEEKGVIARVGAVRDRARFEANTERHHHFVCTACGRICDFYSDDLNEEAARDRASEFGRAESVHVEVRGRCADCLPA
jgi:Fur family peroxide stress response transcriptional regulator